MRSAGAARAAPSAGDSLSTREQVAAENVRDLVLALLPRRMSLVQGPPGTGKTEFAASAVLIWALLQGERQAAAPSILVTGVSHESVSNVLRRCAAVAPLFLAAWRACSSAPLPEIRVERWVVKEKHRLIQGSLNRPDLGFSVLSARINAPKDESGLTSDEHPLVAQLQARPALRLVGFVTAQLPNMMPGASTAPRFQYIVFDEASQTKMQDALLALPLLDKGAGQMLVIGDHRQLGPVEKGPAAGDRRYLVRKHRPYMSLYDFIAQWVKPEALSYTFRLQEDAWRLIAPIYALDGVRIQGRSRERAHPMDVTKLLDGTDWEGICLLTYDPVPWKGDDKINPIEIAITKKLKETASAAILKNTVVLSPFKDQDELMAISDFGGTVNSMQGSEQDTVIYCAAGTGASLARSEEFILDLKRANVAMSRSKQRLIIIAASDLLDYTPSSPEGYEFMLLWKYLRKYASRSLIGSPFTVSFQPDEDIEETKEIEVRALAPAKRTD